MAFEPVTLAHGRSRVRTPFWQAVDVFDLQIDKHAVDGYQLRFTGSYKGHGSAYEFAHGEDVVVVLTWCPPAERRSARIRPSRGMPV
jgi:hypothetical protein